jgi:hypothetical protein
LARQGCIRLTRSLPQHRALPYDVMIRRFGTAAAFSLTLVGPSPSSSQTTGVEVPQATAYDVLTGYDESRTLLGGRLAIVDTLQVTVKVVVRRDLTASYTSYSYQVKNAANSVGLIERFELGPMAPPDSVTAPENWRVESYHTAGGTRLTWWPSPGEPPADWVDDGARLYPSAYCIAAGDSLSGFGFTNSAPLRYGDEVPFSVSAWEKIPPVEEEYLPRWPFEVKGRIAGPAVE